MLKKILIYSLKGNPCIDLFICLFFFFTVNNIFIIGSFSIQCNLTKIISKSLKLTFKYKYYFFFVSVQLQNPQKEFQYELKTSYILSSLNKIPHKTRLNWCFFIELTRDNTILTFSTVCL